MLKKYIICSLILSILNFTGCSYLEVISKEDIDKKEYQLDFKEGLICVTKDYAKYQFAPGNYYIANDTLYGKGAIIESSTGFAPFKGSIAVNDITSFQQEQMDTGATIGLFVGIIVVGLVVSGLILSAAISDDLNPD